MNTRETVAEQNAVYHGIVDEIDQAVGESGSWSITALRKEKAGLAKRIFKNGGISALLPHLSDDLLDRLEVSTRLITPIEQEKARRVALNSPKEDVQGVIVKEIADTIAAQVVGVTSWTLESLNREVVNRMARFGLKVIDVLPTLPDAVLDAYSPPQRDIRVYDELLVQRGLPSIEDQGRQRVLQQVLELIDPNSKYWSILDLPDSIRNAVYRRFQMREFMKALPDNLLFTMIAEQSYEDLIAERLERQGIATDEESVKTETIKLRALKMAQHYVPRIIELVKDMKHWNRNSLPTDLQYPLWRNFGSDYVYLISFLPDSLLSTYRPFFHETRKEVIREKYRRKHDSEPSEDEIEKTYRLTIIKPIAVGINAFIARTGKPWTVDSFRNTEMSKTWSRIRSHQIKTEELLPYLTDRAVRLFGQNSNGARHARKVELLRRKSNLEFHEASEQYPRHEKIILAKFVEKSVDRNWDCTNLPESPEVTRIVTIGGITSLVPFFSDKFLRNIKPQRRNVREAVIIELCRREVGVVPSSEIVQALDEHEIRKRIAVELSENPSSILSDGNLALTRRFNRYGGMREMVHYLTNEQLRNCVGFYRGAYDQEIKAEISFRERVPNVSVVCEQMIAEICGLEDGWNEADLSEDLFDIVNTIGIQHFIHRLPTGIAQEYVSLDTKRPTLKECLASTEPCLHLSCRFHLLTEVVLRDELTVDDLIARAQQQETCSIRFANRDNDATLETIGGLIGVTGERVRQIENKALQTLRDNGITIDELIDFLQEDPGKVDNYLYT